MAITLDDVRKAQSLVRDIVFQTPFQKSRSCSERVRRNVYLKFENEQLTGSFKIRGALNKISNLTAEERQRGIIASSAGNHAQGVAFAGRHYGVQSTIVMPKNAPIVKVEATKAYGAKIVLHGDVYDEAYEKAQELQAQNGYTFVHPYNDPYIIAGQGTIGIEILEAAPDIDTVVVAIGGGGLISGISTAVKALNPKIKVFGVQSRAVNTMMRSFQERHLVTNTEKRTTIADGVAVKTPNATILNDYLLRLVDDIVDVSEDEIAESMVFLMERAKTVVEGAGALPLAALRALEPKLGKNVVLILGGGNIDLNIVEKVIHRGLIKSGRLIELQVAVAVDKPGVLKDLTAIFASHNCNILDVSHDRNQEGMELGGTTINFIVETTGREASDKLKADLLGHGYRLA